MFPLFLGFEQNANGSGLNERLRERRECLFWSEIRMEEAGGDGAGLGAVLQIV